MIFQALGAKYGPLTSLRHLFSHGSKKDSQKLLEALSAKYSGQATLFQKGRAALAASIRAAGGEGQKVAISGLTCYSLVQAVETAGAKPVFVDINQSSLQPEAAELEAAISKNPDIKIIVIQNMLGIPVDMEAVEKIAKKHGIIIIEDLAHSAGAHYADGREVGTVGDITMLSFGRDKAIDTVNGGAVIVRNENFVIKKPILKPSLIDQTRDRIYPTIAFVSRLFYPLGVGKYIMSAAIKSKLVIRSADGNVEENTTLPNWQAKLAYKQLKNLADTTKQRRKKAIFYTKLLDDIGLKTPNKPGASPIRLPIITTQKPEKITQHFAKNNIQANDIWYDAPVSPIRFMHKVNYPQKDCPVATETATQLINLPTHQKITEADIEKIVNTLREVIS